MTFAAHLARWLEQAKIDLVRTNVIEAMRNEIEDRPFKKGAGKSKPVTTDDLLKAAKAVAQDLLDWLPSDLEFRTWASKFLDARFRSVNPYEPLELDRLEVVTTFKGLRFNGRLVGNEQDPGVEVPAHLSTADVQRVLKQLGQTVGTVSWDMRQLSGYGLSSSIFSTYSFSGEFTAPSLIVDVVGDEFLQQQAEKLLTRQESALDEQRRLAGAS